MKNNPRKILVALVTIIVIILGAIFMYSRLQGYLRGPQLKSINLKEQQIHEEYFFVIEAELKHTHTAYVNGLRVSINEDERLRHPLALVAGRNTIQLVLEDNFGKEKVFYYEIISPDSEEIYVASYNQAQEKYQETLLTKDRELTIKE